MKKLNQILMITILSSLVLSAKIIQAATLMVPESFDVLKVDGVEYSPGMFTTEKELDLRPGSHTLELRYNEYFESTDYDSHIFIKSEPFLVTFVIREGQDLLLNRPPMEDEYEAKNYAKDPQVFIKNSANEVTQLASAEVPPEPKAHMKVQVLNSNSPNQTQASRPIAPEDGPDSLSMLKYWWQMASAAEKQAFKQYTQEN